MATYVIKAISADPAPVPVDGVDTVPTAHAQVVIDGGMVELCGLDVTSADTFKAGIEAYIAAQKPPPEPELPKELAALIGQTLSTKDITPLTEPPILAPPEGLVNG